jgi:hypothetical protein
MDSWEETFRLVTAAFLVSVALGGGVAAQIDTPQPAWAAETEAALERVVADHNVLVDDASPNPARGLASDQRVTLVVTAPDDSVAQFSFRTDATARVVEFRAGPRDDVTLRMFTDPATVDRIADAPDRAAAFEAALRAGDVRLEGVSPSTRVSVALLGLVLWVLAAPLQAAAVGTAVLLGAGALVVVGTKVVGGGAIATGTVGAASSSPTGVGAAGTSGPVTADAVGPTATTATGEGTETATSTATAAESAASTGEPPTDSLTRTGSGTMTVDSPVDPVGVADRILSFFERALFIVAIAKKLTSRARRSVGAVVVSVLGWFGFQRLTDDKEDVTGAGSESTGRPAIRRRGVPRRRRR